MDIDFTPPAHPPNNVINNITPQNPEQYSQPMIIDHSPISTSHSSPRNLIEQPATAINQPVVHQHSSLEQIQIAVDDSLQACNANRMDLDTNDASSQSSLFTSLSDRI